MNKLLQRVVTALVLVCILLAALFLLPQLAMFLIICGLVVVAAWEWSAFVPFTHRLTRAMYCAVLLLIMALTFWVFPDLWPLEVLLWTALLWWGVAFGLILRYPLALARWFAALAGILVIVPAWVALLALLGQPERGSEYLLLVLMIIWAADIGAYFSGKAFGRTKLAPLVSPGKTWEGVIGGLIAALLIAAVGGAWFEWSYAFILPAAVGVALISVVGDLTVSLFKRSAGLKDSGTLFPGHGGVLDRVDGVTAAAPLFALQLLWAGLIPGAAPVG